MCTLAVADFTSTTGAAHSNLTAFTTAVNTYHTDAAANPLVAALTTANGEVKTASDAITKFTKDLAQLGAFVSREHVVGLVVGLPFSMDGSDSPRTQSVRAFARNLAPLGLPLLLWDERWSTQAVERAMIAADVSRAKRAEKVDALAAAHILQGAIDALANLQSPQ